MAWKLGTSYQAAHRWMTDTGRLTLKTFLPSSCVLCGAETIDAARRICFACTQNLDACRPARVCDRCGMPLPQLAAPNAAEKANRLQAGQTAQSVQSGISVTKPLVAPHSASAAGSCFHCKNLSFAFSRTILLGLYRGALRDAVILAKQSSQRVVAETLAAMTVESQRDSLEQRAFDAVVGVPSHWSRRLKRRGAPAETLASTFAAELGLPYLPRLKRIRRTQKQGTLTPEQRRKNVDGSFAVITGYVFSSAGYSLQGKHILLVDDVLTTGATAHAAATALREAGVNDVTVAVLARAIG